MNYFIYNNLKIFYNDIQRYQITNNSISLEITLLSSDEENFIIWKNLREKLNQEVYFYNKLFKLFFILKECYIDNNLLILKGDIDQWKDQI